MKAPDGHRFRPTVGQIRDALAGYPAEAEITVRPVDTNATQDMEIFRVYITGAGQAVIEVKK